MPLSIVTLVERFEVPADAVWEYICWHGVAKLGQYSGEFFEKIEFQGDIAKPGVTKTIYPLEGPPIHERMESLNTAEYTYRYVLTDVGPLPVTDYHGYVRITPAGPNACFVKIECACTPVAVTEAEWETMWLTMERQLLAEVRRLVEKT